MACNSLKMEGPEGAALKEVFTNGDFKELHDLVVGLEPVFFDLIEEIRYSVLTKKVPKFNEFDQLVKNDDGKIDMEEVTERREETPENLVSNVNQLIDVFDDFHKLIRKSAKYMLDTEQIGDEVGIALRCGIAKRYVKSWVKTKSGADA